ncbi:MAG: hypothetical protein LHV68_02205 [Elusimicrobia bacterium]|nr:hypothetical protein [Candidatus Liberimonas magnetica]
MKYFCKVVYKNKIEPTMYFEKMKKKEIKKIVNGLLIKLVSDKNISGIFIGKK